MTETEWLDIFAGNLRELMQDRGYSQGDLANDSGLDQTSISRYLNRRRVPTMRAIINIAYTLDCDISDLTDFGDRVE